MTMRRAHAAALAALAVCLAGPAVAQRSLFDQPVPEASPATPAQATGPAGTAPAADAPRQRPRPRKPRGPVPAKALTIENASAITLTGLEVSAEGKTAKLPRPLTSKKKAALRLPAFKSCTVSIAAAFEGQGPAEASEFDICKDKVVRFTE